MIDSLTHSWLKQIEVPKGKYRLQDGFVPVAEAASGARLPLFLTVSCWWCLSHPHQEGEGVWLPWLALRMKSGDFPGGPMGKTLRFQCKGPGFDPWSGN